MKVNSNFKRDISFNGIYHNKALKKGLEFAADNGTLFAASTTLGLSLVARPLSVLAAPKVDKENKNLAFAKYISSSVMGFFLMLACSLPLSKGMKCIEKSPQKYLKNTTISNLHYNEKNDKSFMFATQLFKLGLGMALAIPKSIMTYSLLSFFNKKFINPADKKNKEEDNNINFKGKNKVAKTIGNIMNNSSFQSFVNKFKDTNFAMHIMSLTDIISTATFIAQLRQNEDIKENKKLVLEYNSIISTGLSIVSSYTIDKLTEKPTQKFIEKFKQKNKNDIKLNKYIEGIKIAKPIMILGIVYYIFIPIISTFVSDKADKNK